ncbi:alpha/beta fold hydrolase [Nonomuraea sp. NPDC046570]|uniref:alpha/beta fold hydrolase n=1 Tax=Nonomuraea sp. NPDC046570 TaxID=3155255 RepID=UPI0033EFF08D
MERKVAVAAAWAFIASAVLYSAWVPGQFATPRVDRVEGYLNELAARDQPWSPLYRLTAVGAGLACLLGTGLVARLPREWLGWLGLAVLALGTIAGGVFPLDCAALSDPACEGGPLSFSHYAHTVVSTVAMLGGLVSMVVLSLLRRAVVAWAVTCLALLATAFTMAAVTAGHLAGLAQRAQAAVIVIWLLYLAVSLVFTAVPALATGPPHVVAEGAGPAVLVSSGPAGAWFHWDAVAAGLRPRHRVIRFDRPGLGRSPASRTPPSLYGEAARLAALAPAHPARVTVVAHSVAAWHAEAFARLHPMRVAGLVLVDPSRRRRGARRTSGTGRAALPWLPALGQTWGAHALARLAGPAVHRLATGAPDPYGVCGDGRVAAAVAAEWLARRDMAADLWEVRDRHAMPAVPVTVISAGERDPGQEELALMLGGRLVRLPGCGPEIELELPEIIVVTCASGGERPTGSPAP